MPDPGGCKPGKVIRLRTIDLTVPGIVLLIVHRLNPTARGELEQLQRQELERDGEASRQPGASHPG
jgi:hypothetical protein